MKLPEFPRDKNGLIEEDKIDYRTIKAFEKIYLDSELRIQHKMIDEVQGFNVYEFLKDYTIPKELIDELRAIEINKFEDNYTYDNVKDRLTVESAFRGYLTQTIDIFGEQIVKQSLMYTEDGKVVDFSKTIKCLIESLYTDLLDWLKIEFYNEFNKIKYTNGSIASDYYISNMIYDGIEELIKRNFTENIENYPYFSVRKKIMDYAGEGITKDTPLEDGMKFVNAVMYLFESTDSITLAYNKAHDIIIKIFENISSAYIKELVYEHFAKNIIDDEEKKKELLKKMQIKVEDTPNLMYYNINYK